MGIEKRKGMWKSFLDMGIMRKIKLGL